MIAKACRSDGVTAVNGCLYPLECPSEVLSCAIFEAHFFEPPVEFVL